MDGVETFLDLYGLPAVFVILLIKSIGIPIPIPADVIMLAASARVAQGQLSLAATFSAILLALVIGGVIQFALARSAGRKAIYRFGRYMGLTPARLESSAAVMQRGGPFGIGLAVVTPGVRSAAVMACGVAGVPLPTFVIGLLLGSTLFLTLHFFIGLVGGSLLSGFAQALSLPALLAVFVALLSIGFAAWFAIRRRQRPAVSRHEIAVDAFESFHEASCPVCLALGAVSRLNPAAQARHQIRADVQ
jgi:membrane protein DedA with SNARE-associated domain